MAGTDNRVYGGDPNYCHIPDGQRRALGRAVASAADRMIRDAAGNCGVPTDTTQPAPICPGCAMIAVFNAAVYLAQDSGQSLRELGRTMALAFNRLADHPERGVTEEIEVILDPDEAADPNGDGWPNRDETVNDRWPWEDKVWDAGSGIPYPFEQEDFNAEAARLALGFSSAPRAGERD